jgi:hypothetical protein
MIVTRISILDGKVYQMDLPVTQEQLDRFANRFRTGEYIHDIFPELSAGEREFILNGITPEKWDEAFGDEGDEDNNEDIIDALI